jgi:hypothetical protein
MSITYADRIKRRDEQRLCVDCGKRPLHTKNHCLECRNRQLEIQKQYRDQRREKRKETMVNTTIPKKCNICKKQDPTDGYKSCTECRERGKEYQRKYSEARKSKSHASVNGFHYPPKEKEQLLGVEVPNRVITIDEEIYQFIKAKSTFEDTPNLVLRRLLGFVGVEHGK